MSSPARGLAAAVMTAAFLAASGCSSAPPAKPASGKSDSGLGTRILECVVSSHEQESGTSASSYRTSGGYYIVFEAREGNATSRYRFEVTRNQFARFQDGDRVRLTLNNNILANIQLVQD